MSRPAARVRHDEVTRLVKAVRACGLEIARVTFDGTNVDVIIGNSGESQASPVDAKATNGGLIREPKP